MIGFVITILAIVDTIILGIAVVQYVYYSNFVPMQKMKNIGLILGLTLVTTIIAGAVVAFAYINGFFSWFWKFLHTMFKV